MIDRGQMPGVVRLPGVGVRVRARELRALAGLETEQRRLFDE